MRLSHNDPFCFFSHATENFQSNSELVRDSICAVTLDVRLK